MGGKRAPIFAGVAVAVVVVLVVFFLVLPKMGQVKDANAALTEAQSEQATLGAQLAALQQAQTEAPVNRETIRKVQQAIPPTVDQQGFILLMQNAAVQSSIDILTVSPGNPVFDATSGLSTITNTITTTGSYFALTEFLFKIETLPRAAKASTVTIAPSGSETTRACSRSPRRSTSTPVTRARARARRRGRPTPPARPPPRRHPPAPRRAGRDGTREPDGCRSTIATARR